MLRGADLDKVLRQSISLKADGQELQTALQQISKDLKVAIQLDRRVDPHQPVSWTIAGEPLLPAIEARTLEVGSMPRRIGDTIFVGPKVSVAKLRTLIALRQEELKTRPRWPASVSRRLLARHSLTWDAATEPREILARIEQTWGMRLTGTAELPYDLWGAGSLRDVNGIEALSAVLLQFDRTFAWGERGGEVSLEPIPDIVTIEQRYRLKGSVDDESVRKAREAAPDSSQKLNGRELVVVGTVEEQDAVAESLGLRGAGSGRAPPVPWGERRFTVKAQRVRAREALASLSDQGITIVYDEATLAAANVDLEHRLDLDLKQATGGQLLKAICDPIGATFQVEGLTVTISPAEPR